MDQKKGHVQEKRFHLFTWILTLEYLKDNAWI